MTERVPDMPAPFYGSNQRTNVRPNPRTVRGCDLTWFNTSGPSIVQTNYNTCNGNMLQVRKPWGLPREPKNIPFNLEPWGGKGGCKEGCNLFQRFNLYGITSQCDVGRCGCSNPRTDRCPLFGGAYVNPN